MGESDEKAFRPADVAEPIRVFIADYFAYELRSALMEVRGMRASYGDREYYTRWAIAAMEQWEIRGAEFGTKLYFESGVLGVSRAPFSTS